MTSTETTMTFYDYKEKLIFNHIKYINESIELFSDILNSINSGSFISLNGVELNKEHKDSIELTLLFFKKELAKYNVKLINTKIEKLEKSE